MAYLILHVGPGKCGSTSIQKFFMTNKKAFAEKVVFNCLDHRDIAELNHISPPQSTINKLSNFFEKNKDRCDAIILSHEYLFDCHLTIKNICELGKNSFSKTIIIGYSRKQSDFVVSVYSQWLFRHKNRVKETQQILLDNNIEGLLFSSTERHLIASIYSDFHTARQPSGVEIMDWHESYSHLLELIERPKQVVTCGLLPNKVHTKPLIEDFCEKAGLKLKNNFSDSKNTFENVKFEPDFIEALNNALILDMEIPHPDKSNDLINKICQKIKISDNSNHLFIQKIKNYIDSYFFTSNKKFCEKFDLLQGYFIPEEFISKNEILITINSEQEKRRSNKLILLEESKLLTAKMALACLELSKEIHKLSKPKLINKFNNFKKIFNFDKKYK